MFFFLSSKKMFQVRKEYRKFVRRNTWLPRCLRCSKNTSSPSASATSGIVNGVKDFGSHNNCNSSSNPSAPVTDSSGLSPHTVANVGTPQMGLLHRGGFITSLNSTNLAVNATNLDNLSMSSLLGHYHLNNASMMQAYQQNYNGQTTLVANNNRHRHPAHLQGTYQF